MATLLSLAPHSNGKYSPFDETAAANAYFSAYLQCNAQEAQTLLMEAPLIEAFRMRFAEVIDHKCIDGRVKGGKAKGIPPTVGQYFYTDGVRASMQNNNEFWGPMDRAAMAAHVRGRLEPALSFSLAHRSTRSHGCAAHTLPGDRREDTDERALHCVLEQAAAVRSAYTPDELYAIGGDVDTDTMAIRLVFPGQVTLDTADIIRRYSLTSPSDVFQKRFLDSPIDDPTTSNFVGNRTPRELLESPDIPFYQNLKKAIAMEEYLLREITASHRARGGSRNRVVKPALLNHISKTLHDVEGLPESAQRVLAYMMTYNVAYSLSLEQRLATLTGTERERHLDHAETIGCYGKGFQTLRRGTCLTIKPVGNDDGKTLDIAKAVLEKNERHYGYAHPSLVHVNVELAQRIGSWQEWADMLGSVLTKLRTVCDVFRDRVRILTTYSYGDQKTFFPVKVRHDSRTCYPDDIAARLHGAADASQHFPYKLLSQLEEASTDKYLSKDALMTED